MSLVKDEDVEGFLATLKEKFFQVCFNGVHVYYWWMGWRPSRAGGGRGRGSFRGTVMDKYFWMCSQMGPCGLGAHRWVRWSIRAEGKAPPVSFTGTASMPRRSKEPPVPYVLRAKHSWHGVGPSTTAPKRQTCSCTPFPNPLTN